ncbi:hypothetical protein JCM14076_23980 [Methylosoma difficile]
MAYLHAQVADHERLKLRVCSLLPDTLGKQILHCAIRNKKLLIFTNSSLWASQLRFYRTNLMANAGDNHAIEDVQIKVLVKQTGVSVSALPKPAVPSLETLAVIQQQSVYVSDNELQQALQRLSTTLKKLSAEP